VNAGTCVHVVPVPVCTLNNFETRKIYGVVTKKCTRVYMYVMYVLHVPHVPGSTHNIQL
jgi:hypothetical protein